MTHGFSGRGFDRLSPGGRPLYKRLHDAASLRDSRSENPRSLSRGMAYANVESALGMWIGHLRDAWALGRRYSERIVRLERMT